MRHIYDFQKLEEPVYFLSNSIDFSHNEDKIKESIIRKNL